VTISNMLPTRRNAASVSKYGQGERVDPLPVVVTVHRAGTSPGEFRNTGRTEAAVVFPVREPPAFRAGAASSLVMGRLFASRHSPDFGPGEGIDLLHRAVGHDRIVPVRGMTLGFPASSVVCGEFPVTRHAASSVSTIAVLPPSDRRV